MELHGGIIGAKSDGENTGSTFFFEFPLYDRPLIDEGQPPGDEPPSDKILRPPTEEQGDAPAVPGGSLLQRITRTWRTVVALAWGEGLEEKQMKLNAAILAAAAILARDKADAQSPKDSAAAAGTDAAVYGGEDAATAAVLAGSGTSSHIDGLAPLLLALPAKLSALLPPLPPIVSYEHPNPVLRASSSVEEEEVSAPIRVYCGSVPGRDSNSNSGDGGGGRLRFLIVDDSAMSRKVTKRLLILHGHEAEEASDGLDFLRKMGAIADSETSCEALGSRKQAATLKKTVDVILMDDNMPHLSGPDATAAIRSCGYTGLIVGVTGNVCESQVAHFLLKGADRVVAKPLDLQDLEEVIRERIPQATLIADNTAAAAGRTKC